MAFLVVFRRDVYGAVLDSDFHRGSLSAPLTWSQSHEIPEVSAIQSALNAFNRELLARHIRTCVVTDIEKGDLTVVDDLVATIQKLMK